jgi:hypothetical protein
MYHSEEESIGTAFSEIEKVYYKKLHETAIEIVDQFKDRIIKEGSNENEELSEDIDQSVNEHSEGSQWVFLNFYSRLTIVISDNRDQIFEVGGYTEQNEKECSHDFARAFWAFREDLLKRVMLCWANVVKENSLDPQAQHEQDSGIESIENDHGQ